ncbi:MAG: aminotransferase class I/II-fold pyridoxal phosphate-dependent enzyme [Eubacteriales bacterium]|nr:aminotransferase class I/II-fold pyridoxal phosphate-dependent enzyme [Eubacteriales bacterium]MDY3333263.1 aminotransferase class I/II-fold pyridoxal phosphate-dependent enzyme [Gallibacter sp.]
MKENNIVDFLLDYSKRKKAVFHMPGHKGSHLYREFGYGEFLDNFMECDITEITGADNLYYPQDIIKNIQDEYADLYGVEATLLSVNGASNAIIASIMTACDYGDKIIVIGDAHKSVESAIRLYRLDAVRIPYMTGSENICYEDIALTFSETEGVKAVLMTNPTYKGTINDVSAVANLAHKNNAILIVDQAHGAHLKLFSDCGISVTFGNNSECSGNADMDYSKDSVNADMTCVKPSAEDCGADIVINSLHKTLAVMTQAAIVNVVSIKIDKNLLLENMQLIQTSSPSYILMTSLYINSQIIKSHGKELFIRWKESVDAFLARCESFKKISIIKSNNIDFTKINIDFSQTGLLAWQIEKLLVMQGVYMEMYNGNIVLAMTGIGNREEEYEALYKALEDIDNNSNKYISMFGKQRNNDDKSFEFKLNDMPNISNDFNLGKGDFSINDIDIEALNLKRYIGKIADCDIIPYPPCVILVRKGECITAEHIEKIEEYILGRHLVYGVSETGEIAIK